MAKDRRYLHCAFDICNKRLIDFAFVSKETGDMYCDEICFERDLEQRTPKEELVL